MAKKAPDAKSSTATALRNPPNFQLVVVVASLGVVAAFACGAWVGYQLGQRSCNSQPAFSSQVVTLSSSSFEAHLVKHKQTLVKFYAPWCGHCKKLEPEYQAAAIALPDASLAEVDGTVEADIAAKYGVENYPMLLWFDNGAKTEYSGEQPPTERSIVEWVTSMQRPAVVEATGKLPAPGKLPQVALYNPTLTEAFQSLAAANRFNAQWYHVKDASQPKVVLQHKGESPVELLQFLEDHDALAEFFALHSVPLLGELNGETFAKYTGKALIWSLFPANGGSMASVLATYGPIMTEVAKQVTGKYAVTFTDTEQFQEQISGMLGISEFPAIVVQPSAGSKTKYVHKGSMTANAILQFLEDVAADRVKPTLKSEAIPTSNPGPVRVVVSDTLQQELFVQDKDVFLEIYAPWCGSCKKLEPEYKKLASHVRRHKLGDAMTIAKIDGTANDLPSNFEYTSFPTLYFVQAGSSLPEKYDGDRSAQGMWAWIQKRSASPKTVAQSFETEEL